MKLSRNFVSEYIDLPNITIKEIADAMTSAGNEYDSAEKLINITNVVTGKVISCENHPDSEKLHVTKVDVGTEILDIVCGAPNCRKDLHVIVAKPGAVLPEITIKKSTIRGVESNGMLCSLSEIGIDSKFMKNPYPDGIYELPNGTELGIDTAKYFNLEDEVIDFELTSNRGDLLSILGMAYELGAIYKTKVKDIDLSYSNISGNNNFIVDVKTDDCTLFLAKQIKNLTIKESPDFIKNRLIASGIRPINNVVDISNYVMLETGQPLHFYDNDKLGNKIVVRNALLNEEVVTLDNNKRTLTEEDIVIANETSAVGLAGVMGGLSTEVEYSTKNIVIESAIFDSIKIRKTSKKILRSEASNRFEKGLDPERTYMAMERCCNLLEKYADATIVDGLVEYNITDNKEREITLEYKDIENVLGLTISKEEINEILVSLGFVIESNEKLKVIVPTRRLDLKIKEDIIEEVGRIYGIDNIKGKLPRLSATLGKYNKTKREIKNKMIQFGLNETLSYTLIPSDNFKDFTTIDVNPIKLADPMSEDRNTLRNSLLYSLKQVYLYNKARSIKDVNIFEYGKGFYEKDGYHEELKLACLMSGNYYLGLNKEKVDFYIIKGIVEELLDYLGYAGRYSFKVVDIPNNLHPKQSANIIMQGVNVGIIGKLHPKEIKDDVYVFEINLDKLLVNKSSKMTFKEISKYPSVTKDIAFVMDKSKTSEEVMSVIKKTGGKLLSKVEVFDVYTGDKILDTEKSIAYSLTFSSSDRTLTEEEVMTIFNNVIEVTCEKCNVSLRDK